MRITDVITYTVQPSRIPLVVAKVLTDQDGLYGWGCGTFTQRFRAVEAAIEHHVKPFALGRDPEAIVDFWHSAMHNSYWRNGPVLNNAVSAIEMALWDIKGKAAGVPCYQLWGGRSRAAAAVYVHANGADHAQVIAQAQEYWDRGFRHIRCQLGGYVGVDADQPGPGGGADSPFTLGTPGAAFFDPKEKLRRIPPMFEAVRAALPPEAELLYDIHERMAPIDAIWLAKALEPYRLFFLEDPLAPEDLASFRLLRGQCAVPLAMGELFVHPLEIEPLVRDRLIDFIRLHVSTYGGVTPCLRIANVCAAAGIRTAWHGPGDVSPVGMAASVHMDMHVENFGIQEWAFRTEVEHELFPGIPEVHDGHVFLSERPGWGIEMDEKLAARYPCDDAASLRAVPRLGDGSSRPF